MGKYTQKRQEELRYDGWCQDCGEYPLRRYEEKVWHLNWRFQHGLDFLQVSWRELLAGGSPVEDWLSDLHDGQLSGLAFRAKEVGVGEYLR